MVYMNKGGFMACFGCVAVVAAKICANKVDPREAWDEACKRFGLAQTMREKGCPKNTFLGLCTDGWVNDVPKGNYTTSIKNKAYGIDAVKWLIAHKESQKSTKILWEAIGSPCKTYNQQMHVVIALWESGLINLGNAKGA
jgi:hypothetical protein